MSAAAEFPWTHQNSETELQKKPEPENRTGENLSSEKQEAEQRRRQAQKLEAVGRLTGGVAHDFNNLLTGVLLYCDLLLAELKPGDRARKYAEEIRGAGLQATGLVKQLLAIVRPSQGAPSLISLNEIADGMRSLLVRLLGENIALNCRLDSNLGLVQMDHTHAQQILLNLILNARDAMPAGGRITVETSNCTMQILAENQSECHPASLSCALLTVSDNGSGMDAATRDHLFKVLFTTKANRGTGLGLATVHDIVTSNGGLIHVDSAPNCGTRVTVLLPLIAGLAAQSSKNASREIASSSVSDSDNSEANGPERKEGALQIEEESLL
jgi:two-component system, cell cycle sensor histidine kinase and response regulator CckA